MRTTDLILLFAAGAAVYMVLSAKKPAAAAAVGRLPWQTLPVPPGYGYFDDGISVGPPTRDGVYPGARGLM